MRKHLPRQPWQILVLICAVFVLAACNRSASDSALPPASVQKVFQVQGQIQQGPDAGLNLSGDLRATLDAAGRLQGTLMRESGSPITVTGQIDGQAIHLAFDLGNNAAVLGVGTLQHDISNAQGTAGGLLTGPQPGNSGDWFARWTTIAIPATTPAPNVTPSTSDGASWLPLLPYLLVGLTIIAILFGIVVVRASGDSRDSKFFYSIYERVLNVTMRVVSPSQRTTSQKSEPLLDLIDLAEKHGDLDKSRSAKRGKKSTPSFVKASAQTVGPERWPEETALPLAQFATTYAHGDDHYDLSFTIESARGEFLGECGAGISASVGSGKPKQVIALEVWLFDKNDINTVTKVLRSAQGFYNPSQRSSRDPVSDVLVIEPDQTLVLETKTLRLRVKVLAVEYLEDPAHSQSVFKQVSLKLAVWQR